MFRRCALGLVLILFGFTAPASQDGLEPTAQITFVDRQGVERTRDCAGGVFLEAALDSAYVVAMTEDAPAASGPPLVACILGPRSLSYGESQIYTVVVSGGSPPFSAEVEVTRCPLPLLCPGFDTSSPDHILGWSGTCGGGVPLWLRRLLPRAAFGRELVVNDAKGNRTRAADVSLICLPE